MRSLPFRVVFLCGLGEGRFPAVDGPNPLDLTLASRQAGDVSPRERDKYLFLETLVCARERLYLSYVARDAQTGDELAPSTVVHELMRHLHRGRTDDPLESGSRNSRCGASTTRISQAKARRTVGRNRSAPIFRSRPGKSRKRHALRKSLRDHCNGIPRLTPDTLRQLDHSVVDWLGLCPIDGAQRRAIAPVGHLVSRLAGVSQVSSPGLGTVDASAPTR